MVNQNGTQTSSQPTLAPAPGIPTRPRRVSRFALIGILLVALGLIYLTLRRGKGEGNLVQKTTQDIVTQGVSREPLGNFAGYPDLFAVPVPVPPPAPAVSPPPPSQPEEPVVTPAAISSAPPPHAIEPARKPPNSLRLANFKMASDPPPGRNTAPTGGRAGPSPQEVFASELKKKEQLHTSEMDAKFVMGARLQTPKSPWTIIAPALIPAVLAQDVRIGDPSGSSTQCLALVREHVYDYRGREILIPQGTRLMCQVEGATQYGQTRVFARWVRAVLPNGKTISLDDFEAVGGEGYAGLPGKVNNHFWRIFGGVLMTTALRVGTRLPAGNISVYEGVSPQEQFLTEAGEGLGDAGERILDRVLKLQPTIKTKMGTRFNITVQKDIVLEPYEAGKYAY